MSTLFIIFKIFFMIIVIFVLAVLSVKLITGNSVRDSIELVQTYLGKKQRPQMENDLSLIARIEDIVKSVIGERRYSELIQLNTPMLKKPLIFYGQEMRLPYIAVSMYCKDENEKMILQLQISDLFLYYLQSYGYNAIIHKEWRERKDLKMQSLLIFYSRNNEEIEILKFILNRVQNQSVKKNSEIIDETEQDLYD